MDHNTLPNPQFELPQPQLPGKEKVAPLEADPTLGGATEQRNIEQPAVAAPTTPVQAAQAAQAAASPGAPVGVIPGLTPAAAGVAAVADEAMLAEDGDLIEKAWVQKAKAIVENTRNDPYNQNREINKVKKEYIQKRYNKDVKLSDE
ncbi:MAG: hypothetical protein ABIQ89_00225 [Candidatus Saccharimonadales bacterium]